MAIKRTHFQGVSNIIQFNWHFYLIIGVILFGALISIPFLPDSFQLYSLIIIICAIAPLLISLIISYYIYDLSNLYQLTWLPNCNDKKILNINAGFDEISNIIITKSPNCHLTVYDFYNPNQHTEVSIKRARKKYPPIEGTIQVSTQQLPSNNDSFDYTLAILSAHEIRDDKERIQFFKELNRVTKNEGYIYVTEHLRDWKNFLAYTIGFLHFHSRTTWLNTFKYADLTVVKEIKTTPFITTFILKKNGNSF